MSEMDLTATLTLDDTAYRDSLKKLTEDTENAAAALAAAMTHSAEKASAAWRETADTLARTAAALERYQVASEAAGKTQELAELKRRLEKVERAVRKGYGG